MESEEKEKLKLTVREILLTFCDGIATFEELVGYEWQRREIQKYWDWREVDKAHFAHAIWRLEKQGYLKKYQKNKQTLVKLTPIGQKKAIKYLADKIQRKIPTAWDQKWRLVIFDIPENKKILRDIIRQRLKRWGFFQLQKSVFIYPFDCREEITALKYVYGLNQYLQFIIAESVETELDLVDYFYEQGILKKEMITQS